MSERLNLTLEFLRQEKSTELDKYIIALIGGGNATSGCDSYTDLDQRAMNIVYFATRVAAYREEAERRVIEREMQKEQGDEG